MTSSPKARYQVTNWHDYNRSLCNRASLTVWFDSHMAWYASKTGRPGRQPTFTDAAIQCCLTFSQLFQLPLRQTTGFMDSLFKLLNLDYACPDLSTLCRRQKTLSLPPLCRRPNTSQPIRLLVDSTGVKECGAGEWLAHQHRDKRRRSWIKVHLAVNADSMQIEAIVITAGNQTDAQQLSGLLDQIDAPIEQVYADGAYDTHNTYRTLAKRGIRPNIRPRCNARPREGEAFKVRNEAIRQIEQTGLKDWLRRSGYHLRSLVESKMRCLKQLGAGVSARLFDSQRVQMHLRGLILNRFMQLGRCQAIRAS